MSIPLNKRTRTGLYTQAEEMWPLDAEYQFFAALGNFSQTNIPTTSFSRLWVVNTHVDQIHFVEAQIWS